jgi:D-glycero-alpha-D-manno-heptose-7-phosphate kinase
MNVEAQVIDVPTGLQDYRPAMYGGIAALELGSTASRASRSTSTRGARGAARALLHRRLAELRHNNWEITKRHIDGDRVVFDCFERIRDTAAAMREALERGLGRARRPAPRRRVGEPQAARARA